LAFLEAPPLESTQAFVLNNIEQGFPQLVALSDGGVIGWCDVTPKPRPIHARSGVLGMGLLPRFRRRGIGERLIRQTVAAARAFVTSDRTDGAGR
jgi:GNAT superfamily N-acetyltransferase